LTDALPKSSYLIYTGLTQAFFTHMKVRFFSSLILTSPFIFYQVWKFISPALLPEEKSTWCPLFCRPRCFFWEVFCSATLLFYPRLLNFLSVSTMNICGP